MSCGYEKQKPVLEHISFDLSGGDICCILGANGVGKSTLFRSLLNLTKPLDGAVWIDGENTEKWTLRKRSSVMAYVEQMHIPSFPYRVRDIAMLGRLGRIPALAQPSQKDYEIVDEVLERMEISHLSDQIYTDISGGERQLLMIARALAQEPEILILDEPTASLDYGNMLMVMKHIRALAAEGLLVIFTTHMPNQAFLCEAKTLMLFRDGKYAFGSASDVITEKHLYEAYHTRIRVLEYQDDSGSPRRICVT